MGVGMYRSFSSHSKYSTSYGVSYHRVFFPVFLGGKHFQMFRIYTSWIFTSMMDLHSFRNADIIYSFINYSMKRGPNSRYSYSRMLSTFRSIVPIEASSRIRRHIFEYFLQKCFWDFFSFLFRSFFFVMFRTKTPVYGLARTISSRAFWRGFGLA